MSRPRFVVVKTDEDDSPQSKKSGSKRVLCRKFATFAAKTKTTHATGIPVKAHAHIGILSFSFN